ncbi:MAG TPA: PSD1 and planctomycete cytochrome C domain-containing protein [Pirellulales bacterium]|jgi:hypothetical protein|nr:PSD1 and planctomycete cytochrome C domain-containing protein [Pirellulales bacterium]
MAKLFTRNKLTCMAALACLGTVVVSRGYATEPNAAAAVEFEQRVRPLLAQHCWKCHGPAKQEAGLRLDSRAALEAGGDSGPAVRRDAPEESLLVRALAHDGDIKMPPDGKLAPEKIAVLTNWVRTGAAWPEYSNTSLEDAGRESILDHKPAPGETDYLWAFRQFPKSPSDESTAATSIDSFLDPELGRHGLTPAPAADRRTLARRAYFDLLGLPPSPEKVESFVADPAPDAFARLVEELLASPHYGERWARHWLDVVRYADSGGYETDIYFRNAWRYRDYVVKSLNDDKPYDRFAQEQIAGDEIWPDDLSLTGSYVMPPEKLAHLEARVGTGLYTLGPQIHESNMDAPKLDYERLTDCVDVTGSAFLGLTLGCARCHDHKFDPISQRDYFSLQAIFAISKEVELPLVNGMEIADFKQFYPRIISVDEARRAYRLFEQRTAGRKLTDAENEERRALRDKIAAAVLELPGAAASSPGDKFDGLMEIPTATVLGHIEPQLVPAIHILQRGDLDRPKSTVEPDLPRVLREATNFAGPLSPATSARKQFALWLTRGDNPLFARVMVNRIWQWHFGAGLVTTANDFGRMGAAPSHPQLLDWLAGEFVRHGFSIKHMHRLIMSSAAYQRASVFAEPGNFAKDSDNRYLWRMNRRRLEAETLWDYVHATAGTINLKLGGRPVVPSLADDELSALREPWQWTVTADPREHTRRGLYVLVRRNFRFPMFEVFDSPVNSVSSARRDVTIVTPQALWSLNNSRAFRQAQAMADRAVREGGTDLPSCIRRAWIIALQRSPSDSDLSSAVELAHTLAAMQLRPLDAPGPDLAKLPPKVGSALAQVCLAIFNLNEFMFID